MYVAVKGGERAIDAAHDWLAEARRGDASVAELSLDQIREQLALAVNRVMAEGSLHDPDLAALAIKQARGDLIEAIFLIRAYRTTLPRFGHSAPLDTKAMQVSRRVSATFKDAPGGQVLGPTFDYTHRLIDFSLAAAGEPAEGEDAPKAPVEPAEGEDAPKAPVEPAEGEDAPKAPVDSAEGEDAPQAPVDSAGGGNAPAENAPARTPHIAEFLDREGLLQVESDPEGSPPPDLTREPLSFPASRALRLQALARADEGFTLSLAYSTQRGYGRNHPFVGELRVGALRVEAEIPELGFSVEIGEVELTECETVNQFAGSKTEPPQFTRGYGLTLGHCERKAISMALVDRAMRWQELGEDFVGAPAQDEEFVLSHCDNIQATGFLEHIKLPHYVDFQAELELIRTLRREAEEAARFEGEEAQDREAAE